MDKQNVVYLEHCSAIERSEVCTHDHVDESRKHYAKLENQARKMSHIV